MDEQLTDDNRDQDNRDQDNRAKCRDCEYCDDCLAGRFPAAWPIVRAGNGMARDGPPSVCRPVNGHGGAAPLPRRSPAGIGSSFDVQDGSGDTYRVTLVKVVDPAQGAAGPYDTPDSGTRFVGAVFRITGVSGSPKGDDASNDAALVGSNGKTYTTDFNDIAGYANFNDGVIQVAQGGTTIGAVSFQVPDGVQVTDVQWSSANGFGATVAWAGGN